MNELPLICGQSLFLQTEHFTGISPLKVVSLRDRLHVHRFIILRLVMSLHVFVSTLWQLRSLLAHPPSISWRLRELKDHLDWEHQGGLE